MSSHYFVKENQEYTAVFIDIPENNIWEEYLAWQPFVIGFEGTLDALVLNKIQLDQYWIRSSSKAFASSSILLSISTMSSLLKPKSLMLFNDHF